VHVVTTLADSYAPIGLKDAFVPFLSSYRSLWLGLGALAFDLLLAIALTSLIRVRLGYRAWRWTHWLAYACWPLALVHALGTGSDPRAGWLQVLAAASVAAVVLATAARLVRSGAATGRRLALGASLAGLTLLGVVWYGGGPGARGWAARAGTPAYLLHHVATVKAASPKAPAVPSLPSRFSAGLTGSVSENQTSNGLVDVRLDSQVAGRVHGSLRVVLEGIPLDGGGVSMTASGVAFASAGTQVFEGHIVALEGSRVSAEVTDATGKKLRLAMVFRLSSNSDRLTGTLHGVTV
jgi:hypothetical protein